MKIWTATRVYSDQSMARLQAWVVEMMPACEAQAATLGVSIEAIVAQAALESAWGRVAIGHNIFGIKADAAWHGPVVNQRTAEQRADGTVYFIVAAFRDYPSFKACIDDHFAFLLDNANYRDAGVFSARDDRGYFTALKAAGYATAVNYVDELMDVLSSVKSFTSSMIVSDQAAAVSSSPAPAPALTIGSSGVPVGALQTALLTNHFNPGTIDGVFGAHTADAVRGFQLSKRMPVTGIADLATRQALGLS